MWKLYRSNRVIFFLKNRLLIFRERWEGEKNVNVRVQIFCLLYPRALMKNEACNPSQELDQESNWQPPGAQNNAQPTEVHQAGPIV